MEITNKSTPHDSYGLLSAPSANSCRYPFAAAPDIIRSNQKDAYFQGMLLDNLSNIFRKLYGARFTHKYTSEARIFAELLYLGSSTLIGNRTLGEEYCDLIQVEGDALQLPCLLRRAGYVFSTILLPYVLTKALPAIRNRIRLAFESKIGSSSAKPPREHSHSQHLQLYILANLATLTSPAPLYALSLSIFYFTGSYYHISKRFLRIRYIFTKRLESSDQRIGYEVLGVLLVLQIIVQTWILFRGTFRVKPRSIANPGALAGGSAVIDGCVEVCLDSHTYNNNNDVPYGGAFPSQEVIESRIEMIAHTPVLQRPRYEMRDVNAMGWIQGQQQRKCTLCLEEFKDPSTTTCGHIFCWSCITDWIKEKPECPLCRQSVLSQHVLPLRS